MCVHLYLMHGHLEEQAIGGLLKNHHLQAEQ